MYGWCCSHANCQLGSHDLRQGMAYSFLGTQGIRLTDLQGGDGAAHPY